MLEEPAAIRLSITRDGERGEDEVGVLGLCMEDARSETQFWILIFFLNSNS